MEASDDTDSNISLSDQCFAKEHEESNVTGLHASCKPIHLELIDQLPTDSIARL